MPTEGAYYLVYPRTKQPPPLIRTFENWIVQQAAELEEADGDHNHDHRDR
ncbi:hypothetical protein [Manganibacter manganicus]|nr:hypothetical protein [Pseudaminobacter manganicus]